jgi:hypothetical protein
MSIDYTKHTAKCQDNENCPLGWLVIWSVDECLNEPFAHAYQCHIYDFVSNNSYYEMDGCGRYWRHTYPPFIGCCFEPKEITIKNQIKELLIA